MRDARKIGEASWQGKTTVFSAVGNAIAFSPFGKGGYRGIFQVSEIPPAPLLQSGEADCLYLFQALVHHGNGLRHAVGFGVAAQFRGIAGGAQVDDAAIL